MSVNVLVGPRRLIERAVTTSSDRQQRTESLRKITFMVQHVGVDISLDEAIRRMTGLNDIDIARLNRGQQTCEYNPAEHRAAYTQDDPGACRRKAEVSVGYNGKWHLCAKCAGMPEFARYRSVHPL